MPRDHAVPARHATSVPDVCFPDVSWVGTIASLTHRSGRAPRREHLASDRACLFVSLEEVGGRTSVGERPASLPHCVARNAHASFVAPGEEAWEHSEPIRLHRRIRISFTGAQDVGRLSALPSRFMFADAAVLACARLLAQECSSGGSSGNLYGAAVAMALVDAVAGLSPARGEAARGLLPWQLRKVEEHLRAHLAEAVTMADLAALTGLSESYFCRAFKATTGLPPHRWHLLLKVERCQELLMTSLRSLPEIAAETGFVDQSHLTRVFRSFVGIPPGAWRRQRKS